MSVEGLQKAEKRNGRQREREGYTQPNAQFQRIARRDKKAFLSDQRKEIEGKNTVGNPRDPSRKLEIPVEHCMQDQIRLDQSLSCVQLFVTP